MTTHAQNPRYVHYARVHGCTPDEMYAQDAKTWPGGRMTGYIVWIGEKLREWSGKSFVDRRMSKEDHASFDAWLAELPPYTDPTRQQPRSSRGR